MQFDKVLQCKKCKCIYREKFINTLGGCDGNFGHDFQEIGSMFSYKGTVGDEVNLQASTKMFTAGSDEMGGSLEAIRNPVDYNYTILDSEFLHCMAQIAQYGASIYGEFNWQKSRLQGDKGPLNHIYMHLHQYKRHIRHDKFDTLKHQLAAVAFNAMMEFWYLEHMDRRDFENAQQAASD